MLSVGPYLREMRLRRGASFEEIARSTRVAQRYLVALEAEDFSQLPPPAFTRGFIRAYCQTLGESPEEALVLYEQGQGAAGRLADRPPAELAPTGSQGRGRSAIFVSFVLVVALGAALFVVRMALQGRREPIERRAQTVTEFPVTSVPPDSPPASAPSVEMRGLLAEPPAPPDTARSSAPRPQPPAGATPPAPALAPPPVVAGVVGSPYRLVAKTTELTWLRVRTGDGHFTEENIPAGQVREWVSNRPFVLTVGNAGGITLELNGRPLPALGASGVVIRDFPLPREQP